MRIGLSGSPDSLTRHNGPGLTPESRILRFLRADVFEGLHTGVTGIDGPRLPEEGRCIGLSPRVDEAVHELDDDVQVRGVDPVPPEEKPEGLLVVRLVEGEEVVQGRLVRLEPHRVPEGVPGLHLLAEGKEGDAEAQPDLAVVLVHGTELPEDLDGIGEALELEEGGPDLEPGLVVPGVVGDGLLVLGEGLVEPAHGKEDVPLPHEEVRLLGDRRKGLVEEGHGLLVLLDGEMRDALVVPPKGVALALRYLLHLTRAPNRKTPVRTSSMDQ